MFDAFVSYSHRADAELAALLQRGLERLGTPWWRRAPVRVFRDDATLTASAALWPSIQAGLEASRCFVLLASPAAAESPWVDREARWWLEHRDAGRLFIVATGGDIAYDGRSGDFDWSRTDCLPPALRGAFGAEPLWVDLRFAAALPRPLSLRHTRLRSAALSLAGAVRGINKDELESEDLRVHRRSVAVAAGASLLIAALGLSTAVAVVSARLEGENARNNRLQAESRRLAAQALDSLARGGPGIEAAVLQAALAWRLAPTQEAQAAIKRVDQGTAQVARVLGSHSAGAYKVALSPDGQVLATAGREGAVLRHDVASGRQLGATAGGTGWPDQLQYSRDGARLLLKSYRRVDKEDLPHIALLRAADGAALPLPAAWFDPIAPPDRGYWGSSVCAAISADGALLAAAYGDRIAVVRVADGATAGHRLPPRTRIGAIAFDPAHRLVLLALDIYGNGARAARIAEPVRNGAALTTGPQHPRATADCRFATVSADGRRVAVASGVWEIDDRLALKALPLPASAPQSHELTGHHAPEVDAAGRLLAVGVSGTGYVWNVDTRQLVFQTPQQGDSHGPPLALSADGRRLAGLQDGQPVVWALDGSGSRQVIPEPDCGQREGLTERCLVRLCERLTEQPDAARWREALGARHEELLALARGLRCGPADDGAGRPR